ncbi:hypothetical protein MTO96_043238 [Rhipicephalus appendiculatus]
MRAPPILLELDRLNAEFRLITLRRAIRYGDVVIRPDEVLYPVDWLGGSSCGMGVFGNEIADYVASRAARQGDLRPVQWSLRDVRAVLRTELYRRWALQWSREDKDTALYKWVPDPRELPDYFPPNKALVTLLTGHGRFHSYFHRFNLLRDPRCFCGTPCDSVEHYLLDCQATRHLAEQLQPKASRDDVCYPHILRQPRNRAILIRMVKYISEAIPDISR